MPEGDTIFRTAATLRPVLEHHTLVAAFSPLTQIDAESLIDRAITSIESRGKHLLIHLDDSRCIHSHMGMQGSWHVYERGAKWQKPQRNAHLMLSTAQHDVVCFTPKQLELLTPDQLRRHRWLSRLGPDVLAPTFNAAAAVQRFRVHHVTPIGEALMDQTLVCGIGNVYKSELLFLNRIDPFAAVESVSDQQLHKVFSTASTLLRRNSGSGRRQTRFRNDGPRLWVYDRSGEPCLICGHRIAMRRQGELGRSTYYCGTCQDVAT